MRASGVGGMPGEDLRDAMQVILGEVGDLPFVPELPARGVGAEMIGRSLAMLEGLSVDLQPAGWRLTSGQSKDQRRARSLLAQDLDAVEELLPASTPVLKQQVTGPWTLAATVERPRGDRILADHGARRELAESLAEGIAHHISDLRRRAPHASLVIQIDEPALPAVLAGAVPTASGFGKHRRVYDSDADRHLRMLTEAITRSGAASVVHCCAARVPVDLLGGAGFGAISFDAGLARPDDRWATAFESGVDLWLGAVPTSDDLPSAADVRRAVDRWFADLGFDEDAYGERTVITPACGLASATRDNARAALTLAQQAAVTV
ncbi:MAG TPA: methionine synthase [Aeromicrobium sp.]|nr:methionine synthase [Aeromicrobium sp.]